MKRRRPRLPARTSDAYEVLHDLKRRRTALDVVAVGTLSLALLAWALERPPAATTRSIGCPAPPPPVQFVEQIRVVEPLPPVVESTLVVTTVELVDEH